MSYFSKEVEEAIKEAAYESAIPLSYMRVMAYIESGGNPRARNNRTGAAGLYQFMPATAKEYGLSDPFNPKLAAKAAASLTRSNLAYLRNKGYSKLDLINTPVIGYLAHQQGAGGLFLIIRAMEKGVVPSAIRKNMDANGGKGLSPRQFLVMWEKKYAEKAKELKELDENTV